MGGPWVGPRHARLHASGGLMWVPTPRACACICAPSNACTSLRDATSQEAVYNDLVGGAMQALIARRAVWVPPDCTELHLNTR